MDQAKVRPELIAKVQIVNFALKFNLIIKFSIM